MEGPAMRLVATDIMSTNVVTVAPDQTVRKVARMMMERGISAVPVCEPDGTLVGILSEGDLMRLLGEKIAQKREMWLNMLAEGEKLSEEFREYLRAEHHHVSELMSRKVVTATEYTSVAELADMLFEHKFKHVPVVRDGKVVGVVSRSDLIRMVANRPEALLEND
jgi:CBS domain-containing protein